MSSMKNFSIGAGAVIAAGLVFVWTRKRASDAPPQTGGEVQRMQGVEDWLNANKGQTDGVQRQVQKSWDDLQQTIFKTEPSFWV